LAAIHGWQIQGGNNMRKTLAAIFAGLFALSITAPVIAQDKKDEAKKEMKKGEDKKKDEMKKDGKKKDEKKDEMKK
jgi:pentapeptide MXKDX repeat protein